jgi:hypothetical protein
MIAALLHIVMLVALTVSFRVVARWLGARRGGLLMGLPSTTALTLVGCALERGLVEATAAADACLVGLVAAATLPLAFARALHVRWRLPVAAIAAVLAYAAVAIGLCWVPGLGTSGCVVVAGIGIWIAARVARDVPIASADGVARHPLPPGWILTCRTAVPAVYVVMIRSLRALAGLGSAGRFVTFPGGSLAVLIATHFESGPRMAAQLATSMPAGNLGMLAFLAVFRYGCPAIGLGLATAFGFLAALAVLLVIGAIRSTQGEARAVDGSHRRVDQAHDGESPRSARGRNPSVRVDGGAWIHRGPAWDRVGNRFPFRQRRFGRWRGALDSLAFVLTDSRGSAGSRSVGHRLSRCRFRPVAWAASRRRRVPGPGFSPQFEVLRE